MRKLALALLLLLVIAHAENYVVVNSLDGRDVLSGIFYAGAKGYQVKFMPYPGGNPEIIATKVGSNHEILLIQSADKPVSTFLKDELEKRNNTVEIYSSEDGAQTNLELAVRSGTKKFIVVESAFSDGALSAMPYASLEGAYIIFANQDNIAEVKDVLDGADEVIIYSYVDSAVRNGLQEYNPVTIGKGEDRYEDNIVLADMIMTDYGKSSIIMTEGTYVETGMVDAQIPIVFSGRIVPQVTYDFVKEKVKNNELDIVYLIGGTKITNAIRNMRGQMKEELDVQGINQSFGIWLRFAQILPGENNMVVLDSFPIPAYIPVLEITEVSHNTATGNLMVGIENKGDGPAYYSDEIHILVDGNEYKVIGTEDISLIEYGDTAGIEYPLDLSGVEEGNVTAVVIVKYGSSKYVLEEYAEIGRASCRERV